MNKICANIKEMTCKNNVMIIPDNINMCERCCGDCEHMDVDNPNLFSKCWCDVYKTYYPASQSISGCKYFEWK